MRHVWLVSGGKFLMYSVEGCWRTGKYQARIARAKSDQHFSVPLPRIGLWKFRMPKKNLTLATLKLYKPTYSHISEILAFRTTLSLNSGKCCKMLAVCIGWILTDLGLPSRLVEERSSRSIMASFAAYESLMTWILRKWWERLFRWCNCLESDLHIGVSIFSS